MRRRRSEGGRQKSQEKTVVLPALVLDCSPEMKRHCHEGVPFAFKDDGAEAVCQDHSMHMLPAMLMCLFLMYWRVLPFPGDGGVPLAWSITLLPQSSRRSSCI
jgi:hypothetical protein